MKPVKPAQPVKLSPAWLQFFKETGSRGGKSRSAAKRKSSAENGRSAESRAKISASQRARWAARRKAEKAKEATP
jgi:hypothetical protein